MTTGTRPQIDTTRPPKAFYDWLEANYGWTESTDWKYRHMWGEGYLDDPVYLYWEQYTPEGRNIAIIRKAETKAEGAGEIDPYTLQLELGKATTREELADIWDKYVAQGVITGENASHYQDLFEKAGEGAPDAREERSRVLSETLAPLQNRPETRPLLYKISDAEVEAYLSGESDELMDKLSGIWEEARQSERAKTQLASMQGFRKPRPEEAKWQRPPMPSAEPMAKAFLEETGLAKGTKLRSFIASEIPGIVGETRAAREAWWARMHPEPVTGGPEMGGAEEITTLREEARRAANIAWGDEGGLKGIAESSYRTIMDMLGEKVPAQTRLAKGIEYAGGIEAYEAKHGALTLEERRDLMEAAYEAGYGQERQPPKAEEDPFIAALRKRKYRPAYYRGAGTGLVSRLTPAVRY